MKIEPKQQLNWQQKVLDNIMLAVIGATRIEKKAY